MRLHIFGFALLALMGCSHDNSKTTQSFEGTWEELNPSPGYESFWKIKTTGLGFLCVADVKSSTHTKISGNKLEAYDYGQGDLLSIEGGLLKRVGVDHGEKFIILYKRVSDVPAWCHEMEKKGL